MPSSGMVQADISVDRPTRWRVAVAVIVIHVIAILGLIRAFAPQVGKSVERLVTNAFTVPPAALPSPPATHPPLPRNARSDREGAAGAAGKKARPKDRTAVPAKVILSSQPAPPIAADGKDNASGARQEGIGTGAVGAGSGTGSGEGGTGRGGGGSASATLKIEGDINSARDYPRASRDLRIGASVTIDITVGTDGRPAACRVVQPSPDPEADRITCDLAMRRFRFRPARDAEGVAIEATYRWRQRWFY